MHLSPKKNFILPNPRKYAVKTLRVPSDLAWNWSTPLPLQGIAIVGRDSTKVSLNTHKCHIPWQCRTSLLLTSSAAWRRPAGAYCAYLALADPSTVKETLGGLQKAFKVTEVSVEEHLKIDISVGLRKFYRGSLYRTVAAGRRASLSKPLKIAV